MPACSTSQALPSTAGPKVKGGACSSGPPWAGGVVCVHPEICEWASALFAQRDAAGLVKSRSCSAAGLQSRFPFSSVQDSHRQEENPTAGQALPFLPVATQCFPPSPGATATSTKAGWDRGAMWADAGASSEHCGDHMWDKGPRR